jgi:hypothetical protein
MTDQPEEIVVLPDLHACDPVAGVCALPPQRTEGAETLHSGRPVPMIFGNSGRPNPEDPGSAPPSTKQ